MVPYDYEKEIENVKAQLINKFHPLGIVLFGSCAKRRVTRFSDIDICVIMETNNKRQTARDILLEIESEMDLDVVVCTPLEWITYKDNPATLTGIINRTGVRLLG